MHSKIHSIGRESVTITGCGLTLFFPQNIEEDLVSNTLTEIESHQGLIMLLETQPRLEDILYGQVDGDVKLRKDEIFVFYTTFIELQKLLKKGTNDVIDNDDRRVLEKAIGKNGSLVKFFFKYLYASDANDFILIRDIQQDDLRAARDTFEYLVVLLPFL